ATLLDRLAAAAPTLAGDQEASNETAAVVEAVLTSDQNPQARLRAARVLATLHPADKAAVVKAFATSLSDREDAVFRTAAVALTTDFGPDGQAAIKPTAAAYVKTIRDPDRTRSDRAWA